MAEITSVSDDEEDVRNIFLPVHSQPVHLQELPVQEQQLLHNVTAQLPRISSAQPHPMSPPLDPSRVTFSSPESSATVEALEHLSQELDNVAQSGSLKFPKLAWEAVQLSLAKEKQLNEKMNGHIEEAGKIQKNIDLLLDLNALLIPLKKESNEVSQELKNLLGELKERGIDLWKNDGKTLSKEDIAQLKSLSSAQTDKLRSNLQILFTTQINDCVHKIQAILEACKNIIRENSQLMRHILEQSKR
ncbi:MAG: hypothetical protein ACD_17C00543G0003 [uncultured bacterium]|nr:MAG: hypothetical protein ACD_17C00543G0003 [uncultured bacterium]